MNKDEFKKTVNLPYFPLKLSEYDVMEDVKKCKITTISYNGHCDFYVRKFLDIFKAIDFTHMVTKQDGDFYSRIKSKIRENKIDTILDNNIEIIESDHIIIDLDNFEYSVNRNRSSSISERSILIRKIILDLKQKDENFIVLSRCSMFPSASPHRSENINHTLSHLSDIIFHISEKGHLKILKNRYGQLRGTLIDLSIDLS